MPNLTVEDWKALNAIAGDPERFRHHAMLEAWFWGHQYDHLLHEWTEEEYPPSHALAKRPIPLAEKRPKIIYPLARRAVQEAVDLLVGVQRWPSVSGVRDGEKDDAATDAVTVLERRTRLPSRCRQAARLMLTSGSAAIGIRPGPGQRSLQLDVFPGRYCEVAFGDDDPIAAERYDLDSDDLLRLRVQYVWARDDKDESGHVRRRWFGFRRDYLPDVVIEYDRPELITGSSGDFVKVPVFTETGRWEHGLDFVPAEWFRTEELEHTIDGWSLFEAVLSLIQDHDYRWSQLSDALEYNLAPLLALIGYDPDPKVGEGSSERLRRGKGNTLMLPTRVGGAQVDAKYIEMTGRAVELAAEHLQRLRSTALECMRVVIQRHDEVAGAQAGVTLDKLYRPMISLIEGLRVEFGDGVRRLALKLLGAGDGLRGGLRYTLPEYTIDDLDTELDWPPVFTPTPDELAAEATAYAGLAGAELLSRETATERVAARLDLDDPEREKERIAEEREARLGELMPEVPPDSSGPGQGDGSGGGGAGGEG